MCSMIITENDAVAPANFSLMFGHCRLTSLLEKNLISRIRCIGHVNVPSLTPNPLPSLVLVSLRPRSTPAPEHLSTPPVARKAWPPLPMAATGPGYSPTNGCSWPQPVKPRRGLTSPAWPHRGIIPPREGWGLPTRHPSHAFIGLLPSRPRLNAYC